MKNLFRENRFVWNRVQEVASQIAAKKEADKKESDRLALIAQAETVIQKESVDAAARVQEQRSVLRKSIDASKGEIYKRLVSVMGGREVQFFPPVDEGKLKELFVEDMKNFLTLNDDKVLAALGKLPEVSGFDEAAATLRDLAEVLAETREDVVAVAEIFADDVFAELKKNKNWNDLIKSSDLSSYFKVGYTDGNGLKVDLRSDKGVSESEGEVLFAYAAMNAPVPVAASAEKAGDGSAEAPKAGNGVGKSAEAAKPEQGTAGSDAVQPAVEGSQAEAVPASGAAAPAEGAQAATAPAAVKPQEAVPAQQNLNDADLDAMAASILEGGGFLGVITGFFMPPMKPGEDPDVYFNRRKEAVKKGLSGKDPILGLFYTLAGFASAEGSLKLVRDMFGSNSAYRGTFDQYIEKGKKVFGEHFKERVEEVQSVVSGVLLKRLINEPEVTIKDQEAVFKVSETVPVGKNLIITVPHNSSVTFTDNIFVNGETTARTGKQENLTGKDVVFRVAASEIIHSGTVFGIGVNFKYEEANTSAPASSIDSAPVSTAKTEQPAQAVQAAPAQAVQPAPAQAVQAAPAQAVQPAPAQAVQAAPAQAAQPAPADQKPAQ